MSKPALPESKSTLTATELVAAEQTYDVSQATQLTVESSGTHKGALDCVAGRPSPS